MGVGHRPLFSSSLFLLSTSAMRVLHLFAITLGFLVSAIVPAMADGTQCSSSLGPGTAGPNDPFWVQNIKHQVVFNCFMSLCVIR